MKPKTGNRLAGLPDELPQGTKFRQEVVEVPGANIITESNRHEFTFRGDSGRAERRSDAQRKVITAAQEQTHINYHTRKPDVINGIYKGHIRIEKGEDYENSANILNLRVKIADSILRKCIKKSDVTRIEKYLDLLKSVLPDDVENESTVFNPGARSYYS